MANNQIIPITYDSIATIQGIATINLVREAIQSRKCLSIQYGGHDRLIEPHALWVAKDGRTVMSAYQLSGGSKSGSPRPWRTFGLDRIGPISVSDQYSQAPRDGYVPDYSGKTLILSQV